MAYWNRRVSGRRFFLWLQVVVSPVLCALILLKGGTMSGWDYLGLFAFGGTAVMAVLALRMAPAP